MNDIDICFYISFSFICVNACLQKKESWQVHAFLSLTLMNAVPSALPLPKLPAPFNTNWTSHTGNWI